MKTLMIDPTASLDARIDFDWLVARVSPRTAMFLRLLDEGYTFLEAVEEIGKVYGVVSMDAILDELLEATS